MSNSDGQILFLQYFIYAGIIVICLWFLEVSSPVNRWIKTLANRWEKASRTALSGPLKNVPGPLINRWSHLPLILQSRHSVYYIQYLHEKYGSTVRTAPNQIAFSDPRDVKAIHKMGNIFLKAGFYERLQLRGTLLCIIPIKDHAARRVHFSKAFSQQNLLDWEATIKNKVVSTIAKAKKEGLESSAVNILALFSSMATEIVGELCFGESTPIDNHLEVRDTIRTSLLHSIRSELLLPGADLLQNLPFYLRHLPLPLTRWLLKHSAPRTRVPTTELSIILGKAGGGYKQTLLSKALAESESGADHSLPRSLIVKEAKAFIVAGTDTTAVTATYLVWAVLNHPKVHERLTKELRKYFSTALPISKVQSLPYLRCIIQETLRLYGAVSSRLPRRAPQGGAHLREVFLPEGTTITTQSFTLHRNPAIFDNPSEFIPERWEKPTTEMKEAYIPFGMGARVCIGLHLAQIELALIAAFFFREFPRAKVSRIMSDKEMDFEDNFVLSPKGHRCLIELE